MAPSSNSSLADNPRSRVGAIVVAAGESRRMGDIDKIFLELGGEPLILRSLSVLQACHSVTDIVLVTSESRLSIARTLVACHGLTKVSSVCAGGKRRQDSVRKGLDALNDCEWVIVQDGARPFIQPHIVEFGLLEARRTGAAVAAVPVKDTIKTADAQGHVVATIPREGLWITQTPQVFRRELLQQAHAEVSDDVTDDAAIVERIGVKVKLFAGSYSNIKVTTPEDLPVAEAIFRSLSEALPEAAP